MPHIFPSAARRLKADLEHRRRDGHLLLAERLPDFSGLTNGQRTGGPTGRGEVPLCQFQHCLFLKAARYRQHHVIRAVKALVTAPQQSGVDLRDGFLGTGNVLPHRVVPVQRLQKVGRYHPVGAVAVHPQLLRYDPPFPPDRASLKIRRCDKAQQHCQSFFKAFGAAKIIGRFIKAGKCVGRSAQCVKLQHGVPLGTVKHLMLQVMGRTGRQPDILSPQPVAGIDGAESYRQHGIGGYKAGHLAHLHRQAAWQRYGSGGLSQQRRSMDPLIHRRHPPFPPPAKRKPYPASAPRRPPPPLPG